MRVIAGTLRSRTLIAPPGTGTRPTSDRLRETLFNILAPRIEGCHFLDLYAGTGAIGIEALSRGASHVWFSENAPPALAALRANLAALKLTRGFTIEERGTGALLQQLGKQAHVAGIVFLDPPYTAAAEYEATLSFLGSTRGCASLAPDALVVAEHSSKDCLADHYGTLHQTRTKTQGDAALTFFTRSTIAAGTLATKRVVEEVMAAERNEISPPWVEYPGYGPGDTFWRQTGESFLSLVWKPYYESLSVADSEVYLVRWKVPDDWQNFYFDTRWRHWLEATDEDE